MIKGLTEHKEGVGLTWLLLPSLSVYAVTQFLVAVVAGVISVLERLLEVAAVKPAITQT